MDLCWCSTDEQCATIHKRKRYVNVHCTNATTKKVCIFMHVYSRFKAEKRKLSQMWIKAKKKAMTTLYESQQSSCKMELYIVFFQCKTHDACSTFDDGNFKNYF